MKIVETTTSGSGFLVLLTIVFVILKLTKVITWSWWWVLCPMWIPFLIILGIITLSLIVYLVFKQVE